jgi:hypothetical protein
MLLERNGNDIYDREMFSSAELYHGVSLSAPKYTADYLVRVHDLARFFVFQLDCLYIFYSAS